MKQSSHVVSARVRAGLVHVFTALGIVCSLLATLAVFNKSFSEAFAWIGLAMIIDGIDGPLARAAHVKTALPRYSGERLDWIIDYISYVLVPALALIVSGILPGSWGIFLGSLILLSSLHHFADEYSKSDDNFFVGFPAIWSFVAFHLFAAGASVLTASLVTLVCVALTFIPIKYVHPIRVETLRPVTLAMTALWAVTAVYITWSGLPAGFWSNLIINAVAVYAAMLSLSHGFARVPRD